MFYICKHLTSKKWCIYFEGHALVLSEDYELLEKLVEKMNEKANS